MVTSVQLYSVREALASDLPGTLRRLADLGFERVEPFALVDLADSLAPALAETGLVAPTTHASLINGDAAAVFDAAERLGVSTVIDPMVPEDRWADADAITETAVALNRLAQDAADRGMRVGYHNHWWELQHQIEGVSALEHLAGLLDPRVVLEVDTYWAATGGADVPALLGSLGDRVVALHIKDGPLTLDPLAQVPAGQGAMDIPAALAAAPSAEFRVIEFDAYAGDIFEGLAASLGYLRDLGSAG